MYPAQFSAIRRHPEAGPPQAALHSPHPPPYGFRVAPPGPALAVLAAMALMAVLGGLLGTCGVVGGLALLGASNEGASGVVFGAQIPQETVEALRARHLLAANEGLLAYHDATPRLDMGELSFVTAQRIVYASGETVAALPLVEVTRITHHDEALVGDVLDIATEDGRALRIEIPPLRGGEAFATVLESAWRKHRPAAHIEHAKR